MTSLSKLQRGQKFKIPAHNNGCIYQMLHIHPSLMVVYSPDDAIQNYAYADINTFGLFASEQDLVVDVVD